MKKILSLAVLFTALFFIAPTIAPDNQAHAQVNPTKINTNTYIAGSTATLVKTGGGILMSIVVIKAGNGSANFNIWDGIDSTGTLLGNFTPTTAGILWVPQIAFTTGLYIKQAGTGGIAKLSILTQ